MENFFKDNESPLQRQQKQINVAASKQN